MININLSSSPQPADHHVAPVYLHTKTVNLHIPSQASIGSTLIQLIIIIKGIVYLCLCTYHNGYFKGISGCFDSMYLNCIFKNEIKNLFTVSSHLLLRACPAWLELEKRILYGWIKTCCWSFHHSVLADHLFCCWS